jgi:putative ABC transport system substrate-binding protein
VAPDVAVASSSSVIRAIRQATANIPIVFNLVNDPVGQGFVAGLAHPGGNITGFTFMDPPIVGKWQEMLKEIAPSIRRTTLMFNPYTVPYYPKWLHELAVPATAKPSEMPVHDEVEIEAATKAFAREPGGGLIVAGDPFTNAHRRLIMKVAEQHRLPAIYNFRQFVIEGGLISYGPDSFDVVRRSASYVDRILKGTSPADLPVQAPTKYELVINLHAAKALGLDVPQMLLVRADEVIE